MDEPRRSVSPSVRSLSSGVDSDLDLDTPTEEGSVRSATPGGASIRDAEEYSGKFTADRGFVVGYFLIYSSINRSMNTASHRLKE